MSISVSGAGATRAVKTIPVVCETSDLLEFAFGLEPIVKFTAH
jgi:hypothetical protein